MHQKEDAELKQQLEVEKERARRSWWANCEHLAEQDAVITAHEEELAALREQIGELRAWASREQVSATRDEGTSQPLVRLSSTERTIGGGRPEATDSSHRDNSGASPVPASDPMRLDIDPTAIPHPRDPIVNPRPGDSPSSTSRFISGAHAVDSSDE